MATNEPVQKTLRLWGNSNPVRGYARELLESARVDLRAKLEGDDAKINSHYAEKLRERISDVETALGE